MTVALMTIIAGIILLEIQSLIFLVLPFHELRPEFIIPIVLFLGLHESSTTRGAILSFILGYLWDMFAGSPMGLYTFISVGVFVISRVVGIRIFHRGAIFHVLLTFGVTLVSSGVIVLLRFIFAQHVEEAGTLFAIVLPRAVITAAVAPFLFRMMNRIFHPRTARRREEALGGH